MTEFRFGLSGNPFGPIEETVELAKRAEAAGFDTFVSADLPGALSPLQALAAVARATTTLKVGTFVFNTGAWDPRTTVRELTTLDQISGGRLEITLGSGIPFPDFPMPSTRDARFERLQETLAAVQQALESPGPFRFAGHPRVLVAGTSERVLKLAAQEADGFVIAAVPPVPKIELPRGELILPEREATAAYLERLRGYADGRSLEIGTGAPVKLTDDADAAAAELATIHTYLTPEQVKDSPKQLIGTPTEVADQIVERGRSLGITYHVLRGAEPEAFAPIIERVKASA